jgi:hypothetical protein
MSTTLHNPAQATELAPTRTGSSRLEPPRHREPRQPSRLRLRGQRSTPARIKVWTAVVATCAAVFLAIVIPAASAASGGIRQIGDVSGPQVEKTSDLYFALSDMDAQLANVLLVGDATNLGTTRAQAVNGYEQRRAQADTDLQQAAALADATSGPQVQAELDAFGHYLALAGQAMLLDDQNGGHAPAKPPAAALAVFRQAEDVMHHQLLPTAQRLTEDNRAVLTATYAAKRSGAQHTVVWIGLSGAAVLGSLAGLHWFLTRRTRRLVNPALAAAGILTLVLTIWGCAVFSAAAEHMRAAKSDAFDSVLALSQARAVSYDANADESRFLVDPSGAAASGQAFLDKTQQLLGLPGAALDTVDAEFADAMNAYSANHDEVRFAQGSFFGTELRNITFAGERAAAEKTLAAYQVYQADDRRLRAKATTDVAEAVRFDTSAATGDSDWAFNQYDSALTDLIGINRAAFAGAVQDGKNGLAGWPLVPIGGITIVVVLLVIGVRPRLAEYR